MRIPEKAGIQGMENGCPLTIRGHDGHNNVSVIFVNMLKLNSNMFISFNSEILS